MSNPVCGRCNKQVSEKWKYCRFCGNHLQSEVPERIEVVTPQEIEEEPIELTREEIPFDKDEYYKVLSTRAERSIIMQRKENIKNEITVLLERLQSGLIDEEAAVPEVRKLREEVKDINAESKKYSDIPDELPVEILNDQIHDAKVRLKKIERLKEDDEIGADTIKEAKRRADDALTLLMEQQSTIFGHLRTWKKDLESNVGDVRKNIEHLTIRFKTEEITKDAYEEKKEALVKSIENDMEVIESLKSILQ